MKKIIKIYGGYVLDAACVVALVLLIFQFLPAGNGTFGIGNVLGSKVLAGGRDYTAYQDTVVISETLERAKPILVYDPYDATGARMELKDNQQINLTTYFSATDAKGQTVTDIRIKSILDQTGTELLAEQLRSTDTYQFAEPGTYHVEVVAIDSRNQSSTRQFDIPVTRTM